MRRIAELPSLGQALMVSVVAGAHRTVSGLLGPERGRLFRADTRLLSEPEFFHLYYLASAGASALWLLRKGSQVFERRGVEGALGLLFQIEPARDEFYCTFTTKLNQGIPQAASLFLFEELKRFVGEPPDTSTAEKLGILVYRQPIAFIELFKHSADLVAALISKNLEEWAKESTGVVRAATIAADNAPGLLARSSGREAANISAENIRRRISDLEEFDFTVASVMFASAMRVFDRFCEVMGTQGPKPELMTVASMLQVYKLILAQHLFMLFLPDDSGRAAIVSLIAHITDGDHFATEQLLRAFELLRRENKEGLRVFLSTADDVWHRIVPILGADPSTIAAASFCFFGPWVAVTKALGERDTDSLS
jgi:hypothetical protein